MNFRDVLVVEDNPVNQKVAEMMLKRLGLQCHVAANGAIAVEMVKKQQFPLVLMDAQMPVMDGISATNWIRENIPEEKQPKIIVMTATIAKDAKHAWKNMKFDGFIEKPVKLDVFKSTIEETMADTQAVA